LVQHGKNGYVFSNPQVLCEQIRTLLAGYPSHNQIIGKFRRNNLQFRENTWNINWDNNLWPELSALVLNK
jgi:beta-1,4-mannosyltransferase